jgi:hypothetical protein
MFTFKITDTKELERFRRAFPALATRAINTAARGSVEAARRTILTTYNAPPVEVDAGIVLIPAKQTGARVSARILAKGKRAIPSRYFKPVQDGIGTSIEVKKGVRRMIPHAFMAEVIPGNKSYRRNVRKVLKGAGLNVRVAASALNLTRLGVWMRRTRSRLPIREVGRVSLANLFSSGIVTAALRRFNVKAIPDALTTEFNDYMSRRT